MQNKTTFALYNDDNKSKYSSNPKDILKSAKKLWKTLHQANFATTEFVRKFLTETKYLMNALIFVRLKYL